MNRIHCAVNEHNDVVPELPFFLVADKCVEEALPLGVVWVRIRNLAVGKQVSDLRAAKARLGVCEDSREGLKMLCVEDGDSLQLGLPCAA